MDDARIQALTQEVLSRLRESSPTPPRGDLEARVAALEAQVQQLQGMVEVAVTTTVNATPATAEQTSSHPSLQVLGAAPGTKSCVLEPDKPCESSGQCRTYGY
jgi:predicted NBD/HSP70 family sugar kinase